MIFRVGCSGWSYRHWRGDFYPAGLRQQSWLEHYATRFDTVELNSSFYRLPAASVVQSWANRVPGEFQFAIKASRLITHFHRLSDCAAEVETFHERFAALGSALGPMVYQLPPSLERDDRLLQGFLSLLPADNVHAFEFRHASWFVEPVFAILRRHSASVVISDLAGQSTPVVATAPDAYVRMHGPSTVYASSYGPELLEDWVERLSCLEGVAKTWVYFNNDIGGHAPRDAALFQTIVGTATAGSAGSAPPDEQGAPGFQS